VAMNRAGLTSSGRNACVPQQRNGCRQLRCRRCRGQQNG